MDVVSAWLTLKLCPREWPGKVSVVILFCSDHGVTQLLTPWGSFFHFKIKRVLSSYIVSSLFPVLTGRFTVETADFSN